MKSNIILDNKRTYLSMIRSAVGTPLFQHLFAEVDGEATDITKGGELSCAFFASSLLYLRGLITSVHATVSSTVRDLEAFGWFEIEDLREGAVLVWEKIPNQEGGQNAHIGFFIEEKQALSNDSEQHSPQIHHLTYGEKEGQPIRKIEKILWHHSLD